MKSTFTGLFLFILFSPFILTAQNFDPDFGPILKVSGPIFSVAEADDGDFLAAGLIDYYDNEPSGRVLKLDHEGNFSAGFNKVFTDKFVRKIKKASDGKIYIMGEFTEVNGNPARQLARLNSDGTFDPTFTADNSIHIGDFDLQSDGKIIIHTKNRAPAVVHRLLTNGALDNSFSSPSLEIDLILYFDIDGSDRIIIGSQSTIMRLTKNGSKDGTFPAISGTTGGNIMALTAQSDGKILVGGSFTSFLGVSRNGLIRLNENGTVDNGFTGNPDQGSSGIIRVLASGSIIIVSNLTDIYKFSASGDIKEAIASTYYNEVNDICESSTNQLLVGGYFDYIKGYSQSILALLNTNNEVNTDFKPNLFSAPQTGGHDIGITSGGDILLGGFDLNFTSIGNVKSTLIQLKTNGTLDETFTPSLQNNSQIFSLEVQNNKKILISGRLNFNGTTRYVARLNPDGSFDSDFMGTAVNGIAFKIRFNGADIFLGGDFTHYNAVPSQSFIKLNHKGELSQNWIVFDEYTQIFDFDFQSDGKIVVVGALKIGGQLKGMVRLNKNGTLDETFPPKSFDNYRALKVDKEDRIYVGGTLTTYQGKMMIRFLPNGVIDPSFTNGSNFSYEGEHFINISLIDILPSKQIVVGGNFDSYKGTPANGLVIFDKDGESYSVVAGLSPSSVIDRMKYHGSHIYVGGRLAFEDGRKIIGLGKIKLNTLSFVVPDPPQQIQYRSSSENELTIEWKDKTDAEDGYEVERLNEATQAYEPVDQTFSNYTAFVDTATVATSESKYRVRSFNASGKSNYRYSGEVPKVPTPPNALNIILNDKKLSLSWTDASTDEDGFVIQKSINNNSSFTQISILGSNSTTYQDVTLTPGQTVYYQVASYNDGGMSSFTQASIQVPSLPNAPNGLSILPSKDNNLVLSWNDHSQNEDGFIIEKSISNSTSFVEIGSVQSNMVTFEDIGVADKIVFYRVAAFNAVGNSGFTESKYSITGNEINIQQEISLFPNPTSGNVYIKTPLTIVNVSLINPLGQPMTLSTSLESDGLLIDLSTVPRGFFLVKIETTKGVKLTRLVKH